MKKRIKNYLNAFLAIGCWIGNVLLLVGCKENSHSRYVDERENAFDRQQNEETRSRPCGFDDGSHAANVDYYNSSTGYRASYDLEVEIADCAVIVIYFSNGGRLDNSHIDPADLDEDGNAIVEDDRGRVYEIHVE